MRTIPQNLFLPKHHERKNYVYVKIPRKCGNISFFPQKIYVWYLVFLINPDMDRDYNGRYRLKINPDKLLNRKNMLLAIPWYTAKPHFRPRRYSAASGPDFRPRHFRPRRLDAPPLSHIRHRHHRKPQMNLIMLHKPPFPTASHKAKKVSLSFWQPNKQHVLLHFENFPYLYKWSIWPVVITAAATTSSPLSNHNSPSELYTLR